MPWKLNGGAASLSQPPLPPIARDRDGYAITVPQNSSPSVLLVRPDTVGPQPGRGG